MWFYAIASLLWVVKVLLFSLGFTFVEIYVHNGFYFLDKGLSILDFRLKIGYTANVCRDLRGVYREIGVRGFQIYGDYM